MRRRHSVAGRKPGMAAVAVVALAAVLLVFHVRRTQAFMAPELYVDVPVGPQFEPTRQRFALDAYSENEAQRVCQEDLPADQMPWGDRELCLKNVASGVIEGKLFRFLSFAAEMDDEILTMIARSGWDVSGIRVVEGTTQWFPDKLRVLLKELEKPGVKTYCETGYNAGHTAALALITLDGGRLAEDRDEPVDNTANDGATVLSFDLGFHLAVSRSLQLLRGTFPASKIYIPMGNSAQSMPEFLDLVEGTGFQCDVIYVDGGHTADIAYADLAHFAHFAHENSVIVIDDIEIPGVMDAWQRAQEEGWVEQTSQSPAVYSECNSLVRDDNDFTLSLVTSVGCDRPQRILWTIPEEGGNSEISDIGVGRFLAKPTLPINNPFVDVGGADEDESAAVDESGVTGSATGQDVIDEL